MSEHAVQALKGEEENFRLAFEANPFPMTITRLADSQMVCANKAAMAFYEIEPGDLATTFLMDFYAGPGQRARMLRALKACGQVSDMLMEFRSHAGKTRWAVVNSFPLEFGGQPCLLSGYADITERKHAEEALAQRARELTALYETSLVVNSQPDIQSLLGTIVERATDLLEVPMGGLHLLQADKVTLKPVVSRNLPADYAGLDMRVGDGLIGRAAQTGEPISVPDYKEAEAGADHPSELPFRRALAVPLKSADRVIGVLSVYGAGAGAFLDDQVQLVHLFADQAAIALENARLYAEVQQLAVVDELTGLYNRRGLVQFGEREFTRSARFARPLSALMIDLDHFKTVNDTYGHAAGDRVLRQVADCLRSKARSVDILARYGGEELLLLLPEADLAQATQVAERLRLAIERTSVLVDGEQVRVTASSGVAALSSDTPDLASLIARADSAVYQAKQAGRNRVSSEGGSPQDHPIASAANPPSGGTGAEAAR